VKSKVWGLGVFAFWLTMMVALVRIEYSERLAPWDEVPLPQVFRRILTNPDPQWLNVYQGNKLAGFLRLDLTNQPPLYRLEGELSVRFDVGDAPQRLRITGNGLVTRRLEFKEFALHGGVAGTQFEVQSITGSQKVAITYDISDGSGKHRLEFDPQAGAAMAAGLGLPATLATPAGLGAGARTKAYRGRFTVGHESQRVYIVETKLNEAAWAKVWVDEAGQILQMDTSAGWRLRAELLDEQTHRSPTKKRP
jgi:hypothetical protein